MRVVPFSRLMSKLLTRGRMVGKEISNWRMIDRKTKGDGEDKSLVLGLKCICIVGNRARIGEIVIGTGKEGETRKEKEGNRKKRSEK